MRTRRQPSVVRRLRRELRTAIGADTGFRCSTTIDRSPQAARLINLAVEPARQAG